jgi:hypothetical protein
METLEVQLYKQFCDLMFNLHLSQNRGSIVSNCDIAIRRNENLVEAYIASEQFFYTGDVPRGPSDVLSIPDTVLAARICDLIASVP